MKRALALVLGVIAVAGCAPADDDAPAETSEAALSSGALDPTFGVGGKALVPAAVLGAQAGQFTGVGISRELRDGRILLTAGTSAAGAASRGRVVVLRSDGSVDTGFGDLGVFGANETAWYADVRELAGGDILLQGYGPGLFVRRISKSGAPVKTFGKNGVLALDTVAGGAGVVIDPSPSGAIYVALAPSANDRDGRLRIDRYDLDGHRDAPSTAPYFDGADTRMDCVSSLYARPGYRGWDGDVAALDGHVYVARHVFSSEVRTYVEIHRLDANGIDGSWAKRGILEIPSPFSHFELHPLPGGRLMVRLQTGYTSSDFVTVDATGKVAGSVKGLLTWPDRVTLRLDPKTGAFYDLAGGTLGTALKRSTLTGPDPTFPRLMLADRPLELFVGASKFYTFGAVTKDGLTLSRRSK